MKRKNKLTVILISAILILGFVLYNAVVWNRNIVIVNIADSSQLNQKLKAALVDGKVIELTESEANNILNNYFINSSKLGGKVKEGYIKIMNGKLQINFVSLIYSHDFFIQALTKPYMRDGEIYVAIESVSIGKIDMPERLYAFLIKRYLPSNYKFVDNSIDMGSKLLMFDIQDLSVEGSVMKIVLKQEKQLSGAKNNSKDNSGNADTSSNENGGTVNAAVKDKNGNIKNTEKSGSNTNSTEKSVKPAKPQPKADPKVAALKKTNSQLYGVLKDVKSQEGKKWVEQVIGVNTKMIGNPNGDFAGDINSGKAAYQKLPESVRKEIKTAAMDNLDMSSVKLLVNSYGM